MQLETFALTISGRRPHNEDAICARPDLGLFVVADGMGGYEGGEVASALAIDAIQGLVQRTASDADVTWPYAIDPSRSIVENEVIAATRLANARIAAFRHDELSQMGSTVVLLRLEDDCAIIGHVGDSRLYRLRAGALAPLTTDHSLAAQLTAAGMPPPPDFAWRHVITRGLGTPHGEPDVLRTPALPGDTYLLCSDGLTDGLSDAQIAPLLALPTERAARTLVDAAYAAGSRDNISVIVVRVA